MGKAMGLVCIWQKEKQEAAKRGGGLLPPRRRVSQTEGKGTAHFLIQATELTMLLLVIAYIWSSRSWQDHSCPCRGRASRLRSHGN